MADATSVKITSVQNPKMLVGAWIFAVVWCGISFPVFYGFGIAQRDLVGGAVGGLFALLGLAILYGTIKATLEYIKFGKVHLVLARPPETGGRLEARLELPADMHRGQVSAELACVQVVWSRGSKGGSSRSERDDWTRKETFPIRLRRGVSGCEAVINLEVPANRPASSLPQEGPLDAMFEVMVPGPGVEMDQSYYRWEVRIKADVPGIDLERMFRLRVAAGRGATYRPPAPLTEPVLDTALERRLDERKSAERKLQAVCAFVGFAPFLVPFAVMGIAVGLAGCPMSWSSSDPADCSLAGINWGPIMARLFDLMTIAVPAGIALSAVLFFAGQVWLDRRNPGDGRAGTGRFSQLAIGAVVVGFFLYHAWQFARPVKQAPPPGPQAAVSSQEQAPAAGTRTPAAPPGAEWELALAQAGAAMSQGRREDAARQFESALASVQKEHGLEHPGAAAVLFHRAGLHYQQGSRARQEKALLRALGILEGIPAAEARKALGTQGSVVDKEIVARELADVYWDERRYADAYGYYDRAYRYVAEIPLSEGERNRRLARNSAGRMATACTQSNWEVADAAMKELKERIVKVDAGTRKQLEYWIRTGEPRLAARQC